MSEPELPDAATTSSWLAETGSAVRDAEFETFYRATTRPLVAFLVQQGARLAIAAEVAQETMIEAYRCWERIDYPRAWVYRVAARTLIRRLLDDRDIPVERVPEASPLLHGGDIDGWELPQDLVRALGALPHRQRQIMAWTLAEYKPTEIAEELRMTAGTVRQNLHLARQSLIRYMTRRDGDE
jgi:RNA polymerase sigma-70 factor (ECF subfamily)